MASASVYARVVKKVIAVLGAVSNISTVVSTRIYESHLSTIQNATFPAISIYMQPSTKELAGPAEMETFAIQIDCWFKDAGKDAPTWDDVFALNAEVIAALHNKPFFDSAVKIFQSRLVTQGPKMYEEDTKLMRVPLIFQMRAVNAS